MSFKLFHGNANVNTWRKNTDKVVSRLYMQFPIRKANFLCNKHNLGSEFLISHIISGLDEYFNLDIIYKSKYIRLNNFMYLINAHMHRNTRFTKKIVSYNKMSILVSRTRPLPHTKSLMKLDYSLF